MLYKPSFNNFKELIHFSAYAEYVITLTQLSNTNSVLNLSPMIISFSHKQQINNFIQFNITFVDIEELIGNRIVISGGELITLQVATPPVNDTPRLIVQTGFIISCNCIDYQKRIYSIECISTLGFNNSTITTTRGYKGAWKVTDIIKDVLMKDYNIAEGLLDVQPSESEVTNYIVPNNWNIFELIQYFKRLIKSNSSSSPYMFWEDWQGVHFKTIDELPLHTFRSYDRVLAVQASALRNNIIMDYEIIAPFNHMKNVVSESNGLTVEWFDKQSKTAKRITKTLDSNLNNEITTVSTKTIFKPQYTKSFTSCNYKDYYEFEDMANNMVNFHCTHNIMNNSGVRIVIPNDIAITPSTLVNINVYNRDGSRNLGQSGIFMVGMVNHDFMLKGSRNEDQRDNEFFTELYLYRDSYSNVDNETASFSGVEEIKSKVLIK